MLAVIAVKCSEKTAREAGLTTEILAFPRRQRRNNSGNRRQKQRETAGNSEQEQQIALTEDSPYSINTIIDYF
jgi:hypothetical protein